MEVETESTTSLVSADVQEQNISAASTPEPSESPEAAVCERNGQSHQVQPEEITHPVLPPLTKDSPRIYFQKHSVEVRQRFLSDNNKLPPYFYRVTSEKTATQSRYEIQDLHLSDPDNRLHRDNAFQALANFSFEQDMNIERYERHHKLRMKREKSSYVSVTDNFPQAERISKRFYNKKSAQRARRPIVVKIDTAGLVPAEFEQEIEKTKKRTRIPIWIRDTAMPADGSPITTQQVYESGADVYLSVLEQRSGGWKVSSGWKHGQDHEYMACGFIPAKYVTAVMPFDGKIVHEKKPVQPIRSELDLDYLFDWALEQWRFDPISTKRMRPEDEDSNDGPCEKRQRMSSTW
ncbi:hypothetical protein BDU57DRAFT_597352 [Ampelomyces quisqualis]|uniref:Uncharacterized protein n=1 Tax=Ampelomyces quisqualis TaxID=50730 RepID=A0A6A5QEC1_AMPQU|nr:hypothetical protein BDU57DRAFT_597352 [Ampelomyces quisqualis]